MSEPQIGYTSRNYHFLMAMYNWIIENNGIPHIVVPLECVPQHIQHLGRDGIIILNIGMSATGDLQIDHDGLSFSCRFSGVATNLYIPMGRVLAIYDRENPTVAQYTFQMLAPPESEPQPETAPQPPKRPGLTVVK